MKVLKYLYYIFENIILLHNLRINNFVIITPRFFALLFKKIVKTSKKILILIFPLKIEILQKKIIDS